MRTGTAVCSICGRYTCSSSRLSGREGWCRDLRGSSIRTSSRSWRGSRLECIPAPDGLAGEYRIAGARPLLAVLGDDELSAVQELGSIQKSSGKIGAIEHRFEEVRALQMATQQIRLAQVGAPEIGTPKIRPRKVEASQVEPSQPGPRQIRPFVLLRPPLIPHFGATGEHRDILIVWHLLPLSSLRGALFRYCSGPD